MYYELLKDGTIGRSTPNKEIAKSLGLNLETNNGLTTLPLNIDQGSSLDYSDLPIPKKQGYFSENGFCSNKSRV